MMLFKLSLRNLKKSISNYLIYFATLVIGVAIFYIFNAIESQTVMLVISSNTKAIIRSLMDAMSIVSVFVSFVLGFLIVYASTFMMKRRKKEFGIYMLLGMNKRKISTILVIETLLIGFISLGIGLLVGIAASQGMSIVIANLFEADMGVFKFVISKDAILKTLLYFAIIYVIVLVLDVFVVGKARLISLLQAAKKSQKNYAKNPVLCVIVFIIACILLGTAYYNVTAGLYDLDSFADIGIQILKGIIGTFMMFWSISGMFILLVKKNKKFYYKGLNCFGTKEIASKINTTVFSSGIICLLLFFTICILSSAVSVKNSSDAVLRKKVPMDVQFMMDYYEKDETVKEILESSGIDMSMLKDIVTVETYSSYSNLSMADVIGEKVLKEQYGTAYESFNDTAIEIIYLSDYNRLAKAFGLKEYTLEDDEYIIIADYGDFVKMYDKALKSENVIEIAGKEYKTKYSECKEGFLEMSNAEENVGAVIVPDSADLSDFEGCWSTMVANFNADSEEEYDRISTFFDDDNSEENYSMYVNNEYSYHPYVMSDTKTYLYETSIGATAAIIFAGLYIGIVFLISGAAILSLKELSEAADNKEKYVILRKLGVDEKQINRSLFSQCGIFFGLPLVLAVIHSIFGMQTALFILSVFGKNGLLFSILLSAAIIIVIYGLYFWITYHCSKKIIRE